MTPKISAFAILLAVFASATCGCMGGRSDVYRLRGRVLDAETGQGLERVRLRLRALVPTSLGPKMLSAYGLTGPNGAYELELGAGPDVIGQALRIRLDAGKSGYETGGADIPTPAGRQRVHTAPDITLQPAPPTPFPPP